MEAGTLSTAEGRVILKTVHGRPRVFRDGVEIPLVAYCNCILFRDWQGWNDHFIRSGVRVYFLNPSFQGEYGDTSRRFTQTLVRDCELRPWGKRIPMRLHQRTCPRRIRLRDRSRRSLQAKSMPPLFGDSYTYGPVLVPDEKRILSSDVEILGDAIFTWNIHAAGLVLKEFGRGAAGNGRNGPRGSGDYAVVFSAAVPLPPPLLRSLARHGGCNVWCDDDVVMAASDSMVSIHATEQGPFRIRFPRRVSRVTDAVSGQVVATDVSQIKIELNPPETKVYFLD